MHIYQCMQVLAQTLHVHAGIGLKVAYKQVVFGYILGTSKYNMRNGGPRSLQRDTEFHKDVIYQVW